MSNLLSPLDQMMFLGERALGSMRLLQAVWVYDRAVDIDGLRRFHHHLQRGRLHRRIECSSLPFGHHRWVSPSDGSDLEIVAVPRPREDFDAWLNAQADTPLDAEHGPEWHLAVLPFTDGGAGVSLLVSHLVIDGVGLCEALADAASGHCDQTKWPAAGSRSRWRALREDARRSARDIPDIGRGSVAAARLARRKRPRAVSATAPLSLAAGGDKPVRPSRATIFVDTAEWDTRAHSLGGTSNTLFQGLAARLAKQIGRVTADGLATLQIPVNERTADDTRAHAITQVNITVDPVAATRDLGEIRTATKQALLRNHDAHTGLRALESVVPLAPRWLARQMLWVVFGDATGVGTSNLGVVNPAAYCADGTAADHFAMRNLAQGVTTAMDRVGGLLSVFSGIVKQQVFVSVLAYQPGRPNSDDDLRRDLLSALRDFSLTASRGWDSLSQ